MGDLNLQDARTIYEGCIFIYKGRPCIVTRLEQGVNDGIIIKATYTDNPGDKILVDLNIDEWKSTERVGYVNFGGVAYYLKRFAFRKFRGGLNKDNTAFDYNGYMGAGLRNPSLESVEVARSILGEYPTLFKAWTYAKDIPEERINEGYLKCFAFDHQFAIDSKRNIYYRTKHVGTVPRGRMRPENIIFHPGKEYLMAVLIGDYNETARLLAA